MFYFGSNRDKDQMKLDTFVVKYVSDITYGYTCKSKSAILWFQEYDLKVIYVIGFQGGISLEKSACFLYILRKVSGWDQVYLHQSNIT